MATRFYLPSSGAAAVQPAWSAGWDFVSSAAARRCTTAKQNSSSTTYSFTVGSPTGTVNMGVLRFVSDALQAQLIDGTVKGQIRAAQEGTTDDMRAQLKILVMSNDGTTLRGVLLDQDNASPLTSEFSGSQTVNRRFPLGWADPGAVLAGVNCLADDRIVIEIGSRTYAAYGFSRQATLLLGDNQGTDLPEDETSQANASPWIEFSDTLAFQAPPVSPIPPRSMTAFRRRRL